MEFWVSKVVKTLPRMHPNVITVMGLVPPVLFYYFLSTGHLGWALVSYCGVVLDLIDGIYARATNQTSAFGAFLDSTLDRLSDVIFIAAFAAGGVISWPIAVAAIAVSFVISYARSRGELLLPAGTLVYQGPIERAERLGILFFAILSYILFPTVRLGIYSISEILIILLVALSLLTIIRRILFVHKNVEK